MNLSNCLKIVFTSCCLILLSSQIHAAEPASVSILNGKQLLMPGDNLLWALPEYDDSGWYPISIPGSWQSQGYKAEKNCVWYRIRFQIPHEFQNKRLGLFLGKISSIDETYLNGKLIGRTGKMEKWFIEAGNVERLYRIPDSTLRFGENNILAIRVVGLDLAGGLLTSEPEIGEYSHLLIEKQRIVSKDIVFETAITGILLLFIIAGLFFYFNDAKEKEYLYFSFFAIMYALDSVVYNPLFFEAGWKTVFMQNFVIALSFLYPVAFLLFFIEFIHYRYNTYINILIWASVTCSVIVLFIGNYNYSIFNLLLYVWILEIFVFSSTGIYLIIKSLLRKIPESTPVAIGAASLILCGILYTVFSFNIPFLNEYYGKFIIGSNLLFLFFMVCIVYALSLRFVNIRKKAISLSGKILNAQEHERKRLARELHDGLGQSLLATKLNIQRIGQHFENNEISEIVSELSSSINELREITMGLRPFLLDQIGLKAAITHYTDQFSERSDMHITFSSEGEYRVDSYIEEHMFRVFQEGLSNAIKHSNAKSIDVFLHQHKNYLELIIKDDGSGFRYEAGSGNRKGMGLFTMEERVDLINGKLWIDSRKGEGTKIHIKVKLSAKNSGSAND